MNMLQQNEYFFVTLDCTPNLSHTEQMRQTLSEFKAFIVLKDRNL